MTADFRKIILEQIPIVDVRAPIEFLQGAIPGSVNLPILNDEERKEIGTIYKQQGSEAAVRRGHELVSGNVKAERVSAWKSFLETNPQAVIACFRGGMRSQISQQWLREAGCDRPRITGGYKAFRQFLIQEMERISRSPMRVISGATGSGKTLAIKALQGQKPTIDLEKLAHHRGSAFGGYRSPQPMQIDFENRLAAQLLHLESQFQGGAPFSIITEDESRMIGRCVVPEAYFESLRVSDVIFIEETLESRVSVTLEDYVTTPFAANSEAETLETFAGFERSLRQISAKLGGLRFKELLADLEYSRSAYLSSRDLSSNRLWIQKLLEWYYDPLYFRSLNKRDPKIVFRGSRAQVIDFLKS